MYMSPILYRLNYYKRRSIIKKIELRFKIDKKICFNNFYYNVLDVLDTCTLYMANGK